MKHIKNAIKTFVVVFLISKGLGKFGSLGKGKFMKALATLSEGAFASAAISSALTFVGGILSKGGKSASANFGAKFMQRDSIAPRQIVYGQCRVGGTIVHIETSGTDNFLLHVVCVLSGHAIEGLTSIRANDIDLTTSTSTVNGSTVHTVTNSEYTNTDNDNNFGSGRLMRFTFQDGTQTAVDGFMNAQLSSIGTSDKFLGCSYVYMQMVFDAEKFGGGIPSISFKVKGKNVFDPRTNANANSDLQRSNPALIIRDYITDTEYGLKAKTTEVNDTTNAGGFASAANTCDQNVTLADGSTTETRYTANGFSNFSASGADVITGVISSMSGSMSYVNGKFNLFAGASQSPSLTITDDDLLEPISVTTKSGSGSLYNSVKPVYVDRDLDFTSTDAPVFQDTTMLNADTPSGESTANYVKKMELQLPFTSTSTTAQRLGRIALKYERQATTLSCRVSLKFLQLQPNDWVYLTNERLNFSQKAFQVIAIDVENRGDEDSPIFLTRLDLKEAASSVFDFATNDYTTGQAEGSDVGTGTYAVTAPSNLALAQQTNKDGVTTKVDIKATWTNNASDKVTLTEVAYKLSTDSGYTSDFTVGKATAVALIPNVVVGKTYNVKVRHIDVNGVASAYTSQVNISISAPTDAPTAPTSLTASSGETFNILVSWINSTSADLKATKIYRRTSNTTPTDDTYLVDTLYGQNGKKTTTLFGTQDGLTAGTTYYFWIRAINHSDVHSAFVGSASGSFSVINTDDLTDGIVTTVKLAEDAVTNAKIAVDAIQGDVIAAGAIVEAKLGVDAVTNAKLADNAVQTAQLANDAITSTKISDNAITTGKITANAITTGKINAGAITATEIATNAVTANKIIADAITTDKIAANAITAAKITANTITASEIAANAITATQIAADTITATQMAANSITATEINVANLGAISANLGTITAGSIDASNVSITNLNAGNISAGNLNVDRLSASSIDIAGKAVSGSIGVIDGTAGESGNVTEFVELFRSGYTSAEPFHIAKVNSGSNYATGDVLGASSVVSVSGGVPLFSHQFTTHAYSGNRTFIIHGEVDYEGSSSSNTETLFVLAVRATSDATAFTSTSASDYLATEHFSASSSYALGNRGVNAKVTLAGNTTITIWCFGATDDVGGSTTSPSTSSFDHGAITVYGLNK